ncbi:MULTISPECIES: DNA methyltransferase [unclassified Nostoc]|uniref:Eco57I restriction-modification methylase domain-containing protein n=1 Tax=unclassified Nostoc TaxID=2593658 RepID=UPI0025E7FAD5|nr:MULTISPECIES: DNA methyltransferase [unclassified Nostoc]
MDKNRLAVEMAKLSLWLITLQKNRPFTFVDHALKCGDSLIGVSLEQLRYWNLDTTGTPELFAEEIRREVDKVIELRREIASLPVLTREDQNRKVYLLTEANARSFDLRRGCDLLVGSYFNDWSEKEREGLRKTLLTTFRDGADIPDGMGKALPDFEKLRPFHWELEFPEVFLPSPQPSPSGKGSKVTPRPEGEETGVRVGFDAIVGNPPFMGGGKISDALGTDYRDFIVKWIANNKKGSADICAYFFLRAKQLLNNYGGFGLIATNTIAQGDTREVGLDQLVADKCLITRAVSSKTWTGTANLEVAYFVILQAMTHIAWLSHHSSTLGVGIRYTSSDCFETFPFPTSTANLEEIGDRYYNHRQNIMQTRQEGLTKTYNRFHNPDEIAADIQQLRELHIEMDNAVAAAYDWQDLLPSPSGRGAGGRLLTLWVFK